MCELRYELSYLCELKYELSYLRKEMEKNCRRKDKHEGCKGEWLLRKWISENQNEGNER